MKGYNKHLHELRVYQKGGEKGLQCMTTCDRTGKKVGSADCEKYCRHFAGHDKESRSVICWK